MIRVLICDDHPVVREGIKAILETSPEIGVEGEAGEGNEAVAMVSRRPYDLLLLDISMPGREWLEVLRQLKVVQPQLPVLMLSVHSEEKYAMRALRAGAAGYVTKGSPPEQLLTAVRQVAAGRKFISPTLGGILADFVGTDSTRPLHDALSDREVQVMRLIASGKTLAATADALALSAKTVSSYRARILKKLHLKTTAELIRYAVENGLVDD